MGLLDKTVVVKVGAAVMLLMGATASAEPDPWASPPKPVSPKLRGPDPERGVPPTDLVLPAVPAFELPVVSGGARGVRELRILGRPLLDTDVRVDGYVTWIYDCTKALRRPGQALASVHRSIDRDPTQCERAKLYLGDRPDTPPEASLWVVDVPRPFNKLELERIDKRDRTVDNYPDRCEPDPKRPRAPICAPVAVGDFVTVTGRFAQSSPHRERNSDGLIVLRSITAATPPSATSTLMRRPTPTAPRTSPALAPLPAKAVERPPASDAEGQASIQASNHGTRAYGQRKYADAIAAYQDAVARWDGNHVAWYGLAGAYIGQQDWANAQKAMARAFELAPDAPMYAMVYGYATYEATIHAAKEAAARRDGVSIDHVHPDLATADFRHAEQLLRHAIKREPSLWRAHYYLGRIYRDTERPLEAAKALTEALRFAPSQVAPWIALAELYRKWEYVEQARTVASAGLRYTKDIADLWYVLGMVADDQGDSARAIDAFTEALAARPGHPQALFQRGQAYARTKQTKLARRDLEAFLAKPGSSASFAIQQANQRLLDLAAKRR